MQFPVPQFTDVEDRIFGPLTLKQFGIVFGAGVVVFMVYSATKSIPALVLAGLVFGLPALALAFVKYNGRPIYNTLGNIFRFLSGPKVLAFHKEIYGLNSQVKLRSAENESTENGEKASLANPQARLKEVRELLQKEFQEEKELVGKIR